MNVSVSRKSLEPPFYKRINLSWLQIIKTTIFLMVGVTWVYLFMQVKEFHNNEKELTIKYNVESWVTESNNSNIATYYLYLENSRYGKFEYPVARETYAKVTSNKRKTVWFRDNFLSLRKKSKTPEILDRRVGDFGLTLENYKEYNNHHVFCIIIALSIILYYKIALILTMVEGIYEPDYRWTMFRFASLVIAFILSVTM